MELEFDLRDNLKTAFPTPIGRFQLPNAAELNPVLERIILERERAAAGLQKSNIGGWHSGTDLHEWPEVRETDFVESLQSALTRMIALGARSDRFDFQCRLTSWANVNRGGAANAVHNHSMSHWSGVYYVRIGNYDEDDFPRAGGLTFIDPRGGVNMYRHPGSSLFGEAMTLMPAAGDLVIFPSWLYHLVRPFRTDTCRISIAFNAAIVDFKDQRPANAPDPFADFWGR